MDSLPPIDRGPLALLLGVAVGDALGVPVEFKPRGTFRVTGMEGRGSHNQPAGTWSDDTSLTLALADSMLPESCNLPGVAKAFLAWCDNAAYTAHGTVFDIGNVVADAIRRMKEGVAPEKAGLADEKNNGNGSLMRVSPLTFYLDGIGDPADRFEIVRRVSSMTHAHPLSVTACFIHVEFLSRIRALPTKEAAYDALREFFAGDLPFLDRDVLARFDRVLKGDARDLSEDDVRSSGFVLDTVEAAFRCFLTTDSFASAVLAAVNLGEDADTVGSVTGAMAGLAYGARAIPKEWLDTLAGFEEIRRIACAMPRWDQYHLFGHREKFE